MKKGRLMKKIINTFKSSKILVTFQSEVIRDIISSMVKLLKSGR